MLKRRKGTTDDGSIPVVKHTFIHVGTTVATGGLTHHIRTGIICPLCVIIHTLGFTGLGIITVTRRITAITGDIIHIRTCIGGITVGAGMYPYHGELTIDATGDLKIGVLEVHAA